MPNERISADDLYRVELIEDCRLAPDGRWAVYSQTRVDRESLKRYSNLWIAPLNGAPLDGGPPRPFTQGDQQDTQPRPSPDGQQIAFLSNRADEDQPQIYLIPVEGGEARRLTDLKGEFGAFEWAPDGRALVCAFRKRDAEDLAREEDPRKKELGIVARHITRVFFKYDGHGFLPQERWHLWRIEVPSGRAQQLTEGEVYDEQGPRYSPDGRWIAFCSNRAPDPDLDPDAVDIWVMPAGGGEARKVETPYGPKGDLAWSPDGRRLAYLGGEGSGNWWKNTSLWVVPVDGDGPTRNLTGAYDLHVANETINDLPGGLPMLPPTWSADGSRLCFQVSRHGATSLQSIAVDGSQPPEPVLDGPLTVGAYGLVPGENQLVVMQASLAELTQVWAYDLEDYRAVTVSRCLTGASEELLRARDLGRIEEVWFTGADGDPLQGWILTPPGYDPARRYPAILEIHGGPRAQYGYLFLHEFQFLAAHDYVVFFTNPRGSQGYGEAHSQAIVNDWGNADYRDLMAWTDYVASRRDVDAERLGVTGGSYGGYMTLWIIGHTQRFKAAVAQRVVSNWISMWGSSDMNWSFQDEFGNKPPWENLENLWRQSPMSSIGNARTPTLILHSEEDHRCPIEQGEQAYVALRTLGVPCEMVRFPGESHGLSRGGRTDRRIARLEHMLRWFERYL